MFKQLNLTNILASFKKTITDLDSLLSLLEIKEAEASDLVIKAKEDLVNITDDQATAAKIKENLEKLIEGV